jgi:hypothetical protein
MKRRILEARGFTTLSGVALPASQSNDDNAGDDKGGKGQKAKLTALLADNDELQEQFDEIVEKRLARERRKLNGAGRREDDTKLAEELDALRTFKTQHEQTEAEKQKEYEKALGIERERFGTKEKAWQSRESRLVDELRKERVRGRLIAEAQRAGAIDPDDVADMLEKRVTLDDEFRVVIRDAKDSSKNAMNQDGDDLTLTELVEELLSKKTHLARAADGESAGARGGSSTSSEGASRGTSRGKQTGEVAKLKAEFEAAKDAATKARTPAALTKMQQARKRLTDAERAAA